MPASRKATEQFGHPGEGLHTLEILALEELGAELLHLLLTLR
jgi:hypothetical protein